MKKLTLLLLASLLSFPAIAQEEEIPAIPQERLEKLNFEQLDRNQDGSIDMDEAKADKELSKDFATIAKQGKLDQKDYMEWRVAKAKQK